MTLELLEMEQPCAICPNPLVYTTPFPQMGYFNRSTSPNMLVQNTVARRISGADLGYFSTEVVVGLVSVIQQTPSLGKIIHQIFRDTETTGNPLHPSIHPSTNTTLYDTLYLCICGVSFAS